MSQASFAASSPLQSFDDYSDSSSPYVDQTTLNSKITVAAIIILILVLSVIFSLHFLTRWIHRQYYGNNNVYLPGWHTRGFTSTLEELEAHRTLLTRGLDKASIERLPTFVYKRIIDDNSAPRHPADPQACTSECAVCLSEFQENEIVKLLPACKHTFHTECIDMWFFSHSTCPLCRTQVLATSSSDPSTMGSGAANGDDLVASSHHPIEERSEIESLARENIITPSSLSHGNSVPYPSNVLFWGNESQTSASQPSTSRGMVKPPLSVKRQLPHITIQIPSRHHHPVVSSSRCSSPAGDLLSCTSSQPQSTRSPSLRSSIKRMLSRQSSIGRTRASVSQDGSINNPHPSPKDVPSVPV